MHFDLVIFDCDGVLVDSERLGTKIEAQMITAAGWEVTPLEVATHFLGATEQHMLSEVEERTGRALGQAWLDELHSNYVATFEMELEAVEGVEAVLRTLADAGVPICVASSGSPAKIEKSLTLTGIRGYFGPSVFSAVEVMHGKPAPDLFLHAARRMEVDPARCAVIEDSPAGVAGARSADMSVFAYQTALVDPSRLQGSNTTLFTRMSDLPGLLI